MRRALPLLLILSCLAFAQSISRAQGDETKIIALENLWNQMQLQHDAEAMGKLLDDDFVFTDYDGTVMSKTQFPESIRDKSYQRSVEASDNMKLHRHGDTVVVIGATHEKGTFKGETLSASRTLHGYLDEKERPMALHSQSAKRNQQARVNPRRTLDASRTGKERLRAANLERRRESARLHTANSIFT
jgi:hypothetical protein